NTERIRSSGGLVRPRTSAGEEGFCPKNVSCELVCCRIFLGERPLRMTITMRKILMACACIAGAIGFLGLRSGQMSAHPAAPQAATATPVREFVATYCVTCHNDRLKTGGLTLEKADAAQVFNSAETWEKVVVKLRSRSMPPAGNRRPDSAKYDAVAGWLETELDRSAAAHLNPGRTANLHRLNRTEYANAV